MAELKARLDAELQVVSAFLPVRCLASQSAAVIKRFLAGISRRSALEVTTQASLEAMAGLVDRRYIKVAKDNCALVYLSRQLECMHALRCRHLS